MTDTQESISPSHAVDIFELFVSITYVCAVVDDVLYTIVNDINVGAYMLLYQ